MAEILTFEDCQKALKNYLKSEAQLKCFKIEKFTNPLQGLIGEHFTLKLEYEQDNRNQCAEFFVKTLSSNSLMLNFSKQIQVYEKEAFFYELLYEFERYQIDVSFAPRGLFFKPYVTVMEFIKEYKSTPKRQLLDLEHCESCLKAVAQFHAASVIYEKKKEQELGWKYSLKDHNSDILQDFFAKKEESLPTQYLVCAIEGVFYLIDLVLQNDEFKKKLLEVLSLESEKGLISGLLHGDLWTSNFLHLYENGKPVNSKLLDFQILKYGPLEEDVVTFLMTNTNQDFRKIHFEHLINFYYQQLKENVSVFKLVEILPPIDDFLSSCRKFQIAGKIHAVIDHSYTFMADEVFEKAMETESSFRKFIFEERGKNVVESFHNNEEFKKVMSEDILELRDLLLS